MCDAGSADALRGLAQRCCEGRKGGLVMGKCEFRITNYELSEATSGLLASRRPYGVLPVLRAFHLVEMTPDGRPKGVITNYKFAVGC